MTVEDPTQFRSRTRSAARGLALATALAVVLTALASAGASAASPCAASARTVTVGGTATKVVREKCVALLNGEIAPPKPLPARPRYLRQIFAQPGFAGGTVDLGCSQRTQKGKLATGPGASDRGAIRVEWHLGGEWARFRLLQLVAGEPVEREMSMGAPSVQASAPT